MLTRTEIKVKWDRWKLHKNSLVYVRNFSVSLKSIQNKKLNSRKYKYKQIGGKSFPETKRNSEPRSFNPASSFCAYPLVFPSPLSQHAGMQGSFLLQLLLQPLPYSRLNTSSPHPPSPCAHPKHGHIAFLFYTGHHSASRHLSWLFREWLGAAAWRRKRKWNE